MRFLKEIYNYYLYLDVDKIKKYNNNYKDSLNYLDHIRISENDLFVYLTNFKMIVLSYI